MANVSRTDAYAKANHGNNNFERRSGKTGNAGHGRSVVVPRVQHCFSGRPSGRPLFWRRCKDHGGPTGDSEAAFLQVLKGRRTLPCLVGGRGFLVRVLFRHWKLTFARAKRSHPVASRHSCRRQEKSCFAKCYCNLESRSRRSSQMQQDRSRTRLAGVLERARKMVGGCLAGRRRPISFDSRGNSPELERFR